MVKADIIAVQVALAFWISIMMYVFVADLIFII